MIAALPLALLESVRDQDRPVEVLEDEDLAVSLPRRLGLSGVVRTQISRYELAASAGARVPFSELESLMRLVLRRPDAASILRETGRRVARWRLGDRPSWFARMLRGSRTLVFVPARRATRRLLRGITGDAGFAVRGKTMTVSMKHSPGAALGEGVCVLYTGAIEAVIEHFCGRQRPVDHAHCMGRGDAVCEWTLNGSA
ncbi:MAG: hypothetical protein L0271_18525 [Gemmatimonadetes bacterium]|nr:hypothetical protein [Gemmatimonadota bacterium]